MSKQPKNERPLRPKELSHRNVVDYVDKVLRLENDDQEVIRIKYNKIHNATTHSTVLSWLPIGRRLDLVFQNPGAKEIDAAVIVAETVDMENRTELVEKRLKLLKRSIATLVLTNARRKILILTHTATYFALRRYLKSLVDSENLIRSNVEPKYFTVNDLRGKNGILETELTRHISEELWGLEVRLVPFPVFINDEIAPKLKNLSLTFSQILGSFQHGILELDDLPEFGYMAAPQKDKNLNTSESSNSKPKPKPWKQEVKVKEIITYLFERSGFMKDHKGKSTYRGNSGKSTPDSSSKLKQKVRS